MKALLLLLLGSCAFIQGAVKPASVAAAGAGGAAVAGPAGAAAAAGGVSAAWDVADAQEGQDSAEQRLDALTLAAITGETEPIRQQLTSDRTYFQKKLDLIINWAIFAAIVYLLKQFLWSWLTTRKIKKIAK